VPVFVGVDAGGSSTRVVAMRDEHGTDHKVLSISCRDPRFSEVRSLDGAGNHLLREIEHFFRVYKDLEEKEVEVLGWIDLAQTHQIISDCHQRLTGKALPSPGSGG